MAHYCIVRADLPHGNQAAQLIHAAGESSPGKLPEGTFAYALHARDEAHIRLISWQLTVASIPHKCIIESDAPFTDQVMAIGVEPCERERVKKLLRGLPLVK